MRRPVRRGPRMREALGAAAIPTWAQPSGPARHAADVRFRPAPGWLPRGRRVYAIGDVHGCSDKLQALHRLIAEDLVARPVQAPLLVYLGDYINQGPDSAGVLELLSAGSPVPNLPAVHLLGDHDRMLRDALDGDRAAATDWLWSGGRAALPGWGLDPDLPREAWEAALPPHHVAFLRRLTLSHREGDYLFVHAGIRPGVALAEQSPDDITTMRQPFLFTEQDFGVVVVHGHSGAPSAVVTANRIGLDTGAGAGGLLSCAVLEEDRIALLGV